MMNDLRQGGLLRQLLHSRFEPGLVTDQVHQPTVLGAPDDLVRPGQPHQDPDGPPQTTAVETGQRVIEDEGKEPAVRQLFRQGKAKRQVELIHRPQGERCRINE